MTASPPKPPETRYPSAGVAPRRAGQVTVFDARNHLPRIPPDDWSVPEVMTREENDASPQYLVHAEGGVGLGVRLKGEDDRRLLVVQMLSHEPIPEKRVARILRRFRNCGPFVETHHEHLAPSASAGEAAVRAFIAKAHPASPDSWAVVARMPPLLRVEPSGGDAESVTTATADLANHLPSPLPGPWRELATPESIRRHGARVFSVPGGEVLARLKRAEGSDVEVLSVSLFPPPPSTRRLGDETARALLAPFRSHGVFEEVRCGREERAAGVRMFLARVT